MKVKNLNKFSTFIFSWIISAYLISLNFTTFDKYTHLFFSQHYKNNWFSLIEYKVGGGIDLSTYPPLAHQMLALFSFILPLEISYWSLLLIFWSLLSFYSLKFFLEFLEEKNQKIGLVYLFIFFSPALLTTIFVFGQFTTIIGLAFGFISLYYFLRFLKSEKNSMLLLSSLSFPLTAFSHNISFLLISIFYFFILFFERKLALKRWKKILLFLISSLSLIGIIYYPQISKAFYSSLIPTKEIFHWSRNPLATELDLKRLYYFYGTSIFGMTFPVYFFLLYKKLTRKYFSLYCIAIIFFLFGLGRTTPLSKIFLNLEYWLTYERFSLVACIIFSFFFASFVINAPKFEVGFKRYRINVLTLAFLLLYIVINLKDIFYVHNLFFPDPIKHYDKREEITTYILNFLNNVSGNYRYQTFGYGRPIGEIYLYSKLSTLDTDYFTGRTLDWMRNSGMDEIDQVKDRSFLDIFFNHTEKYSVKYIITCEDFYHEYMKNKNWKLVENKSFDGKRVIIWENPKQVKEIVENKENITFFNYLWGVLPISILILFLSFSLIYRRRIL